MLDSPRTEYGTLTRLEAEIASLYVEHGLRPKEIADHFGLRACTVRSTIARWGLPEEREMHVRQVLESVPA